MENQQPKSGVTTGGHQFKFLAKGQDSKYPLIYEIETLEGNWEVVQVNSQGKGPKKIGSAYSLEEAFKPERGCKTCVHDGMQCYTPSGCTGCGGDGEYLNYVATP